MAAEVTGDESGPIGRLRELRQHRQLWCLAVGGSRGSIRPAGLGRRPRARRSIPVANALDSPGRVHEVDDDLCWRLGVLRVLTPDVLARVRRAIDGANANVELPEVWVR